MFSLVAAYSDSEPEETEENHNTAEGTGDVRDVKRNFGGAKRDEDNSQNRKAKDNIEYDDEDYVGSGVVDPFSTFGEAEDSEDDDDESEDEDFEEEQSKPMDLKSKTPLSNPFRETLSASSAEKHESVFEIPFLDQEIKKSKALERHVKMTQAAGTQEMINGKKICWNYRKGRCRFGHNCTFAHDSDIQQTVDKSVSQPKNAVTPFLSVVEKPGASEPYAESAVVAASPHLGQTNMPKLNKSRGDSDEDDDNSSDRTGEGIGKKAKKRRPGLSQTLTPGKKVMKMYYQQQQQGSNS